MSCIVLTIAHHYGFGRHFFYLTSTERVDSQRLTFINEPLGKAWNFRSRWDGKAIADQIWKALLVQHLVDFLSWRYCIVCLGQPNTSAGSSSSLWPRPSSSISPPQSPYSHSALMFARSGTRPNIQGHVGVLWSRNTLDSFKDVRSSWALGEHGKKGAILLTNESYFTACNAATDLTLTLLPGYIFWSLQMTKRMKLGLASLMCLSILWVLQPSLKLIFQPWWGNRFTELI